MFSVRLPVNRRLLSFWDMKIPMWIFDWEGVITPTPMLFKGQWDIKIIISYPITIKMRYKHYVFHITQIFSDVNKKVIHFSYFRKEKKNVSLEKNQKIGRNQRVVA